MPKYIFPHASRESFGNDALRIVICQTCNVIVAQDRGLPIDIALIAVAVASHLNSPPVLGVQGKHEIITTDVAQKGCADGLEIYPAPNKYNH